MSLIKSCLSGLGLFFILNAGNLADTFTGVAYELGGDTLLYEEHHQLERKDGQPISETVHYRQPDGALIAIKELDYREPARPSYHIRFNTNGRTEQVEVSADGVRIDSKKEGRLDWPKGPAVIDGGFHYFIQSHFDSLTSSQRLDFHFLSPSRLSWTSLQIEPQPSNRRHLELKLSLQNPLLNWIIDPIFLTYERDTRRLLEYRGLTNLPRPDGDGNYRARIVYHYGTEG